MHDARAEILQWVNEGVLPRERVHDALRTAGVTPSAAQWRDFLERSLTWLGATLVAAAAVYFVAANWQALGRYAKFALIEGALVVALACVWWRELDSLAGRVALFAAAVLTGVLLALVGQVYQTGADTFELFALWAAAITAWVMVGRQPALWLLWLALVNIAVVLYFRILAGQAMSLTGLLFAPRDALWVVFVLDAAALALWEWLASRTGGWLAVHAGASGRSAQRGRARALRLFGFAPLRPGVWVRPDNLAAALDDVRRELGDLGLPAGDLVCTLSELDPATDARARRLWDVAALRRTYRRLGAALAASEAHLDRLTPAAAMAESFVLGGKALRELVLDPLLPEAICPAAERDTLLDQMRRYDRLGRLAWGRLLQRFDVPSLRTPVDSRLGASRAQRAS